MGALKSESAKCRHVEICELKFSCSEVFNLLLIAFRLIAAALILGNIYQYICRLDIPMHDPPRMQIVKPQEALQQAAPDDFLAEVFAMIQFIALYIFAF